MLTVHLPQIQRDRVSCFSDIKDGLKCAVNTTAESVEASLRVCTSEMRVSFLVQQYQDIKSTYDNAEVQSLYEETTNNVVNIIIAECMYYNNNHGLGVSQQSLSVPPQTHCQFCYCCICVYNRVH